MLLTEDKEPLLLIAHLCHPEILNARGEIERGGQLQQVRRGLVLKHKLLFVSK
jgi:hypothetical protein